ncbi:hypothetical protein WR25_20608 [Diploscapter pachys]|uniref:Uncharacterized protein n=1 Tax=Diploscapter pachys TaxID=2018661 RepID=A0A2A2K537_9BILA|nr:hypothetical protein WR25_20608 [Diploscapter pachys]
MADLPRGGVAKGQAALVIEVGEAVGHKAWLVGQPVELPGPEHYVHLAGPRIDDIVGHSLGVLAPVDPGQPLGQKSLAIDCPTREKGPRFALPGLLVMIDTATSL